MRALKGILLVFLLLCGGISNALPSGSEPTEYEDVLVFVRVQGVGGFDLTALYGIDNNRLYLPVADLFNFLRIRNEPSMQEVQISGFFIDENRPYLIDHASRSITIDGKTIQLSSADMVRTETGLFLHTAVFGHAFGLHASFHFRSMSVDIRTDLELPAIREMRLLMLRRNLEQLKGEVKADTTMERNYNFFRAGMFDWAISSTQISQRTTDNRVSLGLGLELLYGETHVFLNHSTRDGWNWRNQHYQWRYVNNDNRLLRQVRAGKIGPGSIASVYDPLHGVSFTNASTTFRRSFGEYSLSDYTEPGWTAELYVNNVLVEYQVADASGYYSFDVPLVYGASQVMLKFYGPYGEERIREQFINIPFHFLPRGEVEYTVTAGVLQDTMNSRYVRVITGFGVSRFLTLGAGIEYLTAIPGRTDIPFANLSLAPLSNLMLHGEYAHGVRSRGLISYRLPSNIMFELDYTNYANEQQAIRFNYLEEKRAMVNIPFSAKWLRGSARLSYKQNVYQYLNYNTADATFSTQFGPVNTNVSGFATWVSERDPYIYTNVTLGIRLRKQWILRPQMQYDFTNDEIVSYKMDIERRIRRTGFLSLGYQENVIAGYRSVEVSLRWDMPFAQFNTASRLSNFDLTTTQGARGTIALGSGNGYIHTDSRSSIGRGGITIIPFIDINHNGIRDDGEPLASGLILRLNGGRTIRQVKDSLIRIVELEPYVSYIIELDDASLDNIAWQLPFRVIRVKTDPNQFKKIYIPVQPGGEINGMITLKEGQRIRGLGRILMNVYSTDGTLVRQVMSESDGFMTFLGLPPGEYYAQIDPVQLSRIGMVAMPGQIPFIIEPMIIGDIVDGLDFELQRIVTSIGQAETEDDPVASSEHRDDPSTTSVHQVDPTATEKDDPTATPVLQVEPPSGEEADPSITSEHHVDPTATEKDDPSATTVHQVDPPSGEETKSLSCFDPAVGEWFVQSGAFRSATLAAGHFNRILTAMDSQCHPGIVLEDGLFRIRAGHFVSSGDAALCRSNITRLGVAAYTGRSNYGTFYNEIGSFGTLSDALQAAQAAGTIVNGRVVIIFTEGKFIVRTGYFDSEAGAAAQRESLINHGFHLR